MPLTFFVLSATMGIIRAKDGESLKGWGLTALFYGAGDTDQRTGYHGAYPAGGTVRTLVGQDSDATFNWKRWYIKLGLALVCGAALALAWALPAARAGGQVYCSAILWGQTAGRMINSFAHCQPAWWYLGNAAPCALPPGSASGSYGITLTGYLLIRGTRLCLIWGRFIPPRAVPDQRKTDPLHGAPYSTH